MPTYCTFPSHLQNKYFKLSHPPSQRSISTYGKQAVYSYIVTGSVWRRCYGERNIHVLTAEKILFGPHPKLEYTGALVARCFVCVSSACINPLKSEKWKHFSIKCSIFPKNCYLDGPKVSAVCPSGNSNM
jgi:hypothetical protein